MSALKMKNKIPWVHMLKKCATRTCVGKCGRFVMINVFCGPVLTVVTVNVQPGNIAIGLSISQLQTAVTNKMMHFTNCAVLTEQTCCETGLGFLRTICYAACIVAMSCGFQTHRSLKCLAFTEPVFRHVRIVAKSACPSVCLSAYISADPTGQISVNWGLL